MKTQAKKTISKKAGNGIKIRAAIRAGGLSGFNHSRALGKAGNGIKIRAAIRAGGLTTTNHNRSLLG
jgi:hypothetical protein